MKEKATIIAILDGVPQGYVKSVSYVNKTFSLTKDRGKAKGYATNDRVQKEIDFLTLIGNPSGYIFIYN